MAGLPEVQQAEGLHTGLRSLTYTDKAWVHCDQDKYLSTHFKDEREIPGDQKQKKKPKTSWYVRAGGPESLGVLSWSM